MNMGKKLHYDDRMGLLKQPFKGLFRNTKPSTVVITSDEETKESVPVSVPVPAPLPTSFAIEIAQETKLTTKKEEKENQNSKVIFRGTKYFWRNRCSLELLLIDHLPFHCIEVIAYDPRADKKIPSLFVDSKKIKALLDKSHGQAHDHPHHHDKHQPQCQCSSQQYIVDYILARIMIDCPFSATTIPTTTTNSMEIKLNQLYDDKINEQTGLLETICSPPKELIPFAFHGIRCIPVQEFQQSLHDLNNDQSFISKQFATVSKLMTEVRHVLGFSLQSGSGSSGGKDDSYQISPYPSPCHRTSFLFSNPKRRGSIDDNFILENTSSSSNEKKKKDVAANPGSEKVAMEKPAEGNEETPMKRSHRGHQPGLKLVHSFGSMNKMNTSFLLNNTTEDEEPFSSQPPLFLPYPLTPMNTMGTIDTMALKTVASDQTHSTTDEEEPTPSNESKSIESKAHPPTIKPRPMTAAPSLPVRLLKKESSFLDSKPKNLSIQKLKSKKKSLLVRSKTRKDLLSKTKTQVDGMSSNRLHTVRF